MKSKYHKNKGATRNKCYRDSNGGMALTKSV